MIAHRISRGVEKDVAPESLEPDQLILVKPGETIPADGVIVEGATAVNEHSITGYAASIEKFPASNVFAGSVNLSSRIVVRVSARETFQSRVEERKRRARESTSSEETSARAAIAVAALTVLVAAGLTGLVWYRLGLAPAAVSVAAVLLGGAPWLFRTRRGVYSAAVASLAEQGALVKDCDTLAKLNDVRTILFDKTGVLTTGDIRVEHVVSFKPYTQQQVLNLAATVEHKSKHPIAHTIVAFSRSLGASFQRMELWKEEPGMGVSAKVNANTVLVGSAAFMRRHRVKLVQPDEHMEAARTIVYVASGGEVIGYLALSDSSRDDAKQLVHELKQHRRVVLVSGDHEDTAAAVAMRLGVHEVTAKASAGSGAAYVTLAERTAADVTITLGKRFADVTLLRPELRLVAKLFAAARECRQKIRRRLLGASIYHVVVLPLAAVSYVFLGAWSVAAAAAVMLLATAVSRLGKNGPAGI